MDFTSRPFSTLHDKLLLNSDLETVENCLKDGEDPNSINEYGFTPLHCVTYENEEAYKMVQLLLNYGADMLNRDHGLGRLPFEYALRVANKKACQTFVDGGFSLQKSHRMRNGTYELLSNVYLGSSDPSVYEMVEVDSIEVLQVLVDLGVDLSATLSSRGENLLHKAIERDASIETIQFLIRAGISINSRNSLGMTPLHIMLRMLYSSPSDRYDEENSRPSKIVKLFVNEGYDINSQDIFGRALLHYVTAELQHNSILQFIIDHGADVNIKDRNGVAPLHLACSLKNTANVKVMFENGCLVDIADNNGATVFHYTVFYNNSTMLHYLLTDQCTDSCLASKPDNSGRTPLQWARYFGYVQLIDLFENFFRSLNEGFKRERLPDVFPLRDEVEEDFKMQEVVESMQSEDFSLNTDPNRTLQKLLKSPVIGKLPEIAETQDVKTAVSKVIERVAVEVSKTCPLFTFQPEISGSVSEGTKCGSPDEFDFLCTMVKFSECFQEPTVASSPSMFCQLQIKPDFCLPEHNIMQYMDKDNSLKSSKLISDFSDQLNEAFLEKEIWEDILTLAPVSKCFTWANAIKATFRWHGQVYRDMLIDVDIVPALYFPNFWPPNVSESALLNSQMKERGVHVVMALHGERFFKSREKHFRLSFSLAETKIFQALPEQVRLSYILAKAVRSAYTCSPIASRIETVQEQPSGSDDDDDDDDDNDDDAENDEPTDLSKWPDHNIITAEKVISSYFLKNALFTLVNKAYQKEVDLDIQNSSEDQVIIWAKQIYDFIENCLEQEKLPSFFVPSVNLLEKNYDWEQHDKVFYGGLDLRPKDEDLTLDSDDESEDTIMADPGDFRKPVIKMLKGILQSHW